jgi:Domain of unknown function (DUF4296)
MIDNQPKQKIQKKIRIAAACLVVLCVIACKTKGDFPKGMIEKQKMAHIIAEIQEAEALVSKMYFNDFDSSKVAFRYLENNIMTNYGVDTATYRKSYETYAGYPDEMQEIYNDVLKLLKAKNDSTTKANTPKTAKP